MSDIRPDRRTQPARVATALFLLLPMSISSHRKAYCLAYYLIPENREKKKAQCRAYRLRNIEKIRVSRAAHDRVNREKNRRYQSSWRRKNRVRVRKTQRANRHFRYRKDPCFRLASLLRTRLNRAIKGAVKGGSAVQDLGCSFEELKQRFERQFLPGMTWSNQGNGAGEWNIDHIQPLASFDLIDRVQFLKACHFANLQPLWAKDNQTKRDRIFVPVSQHTAQAGGRSGFFSESSHGVLD